MGEREKEECPDCQFHVLAPNTTAIPQIRETGMIMVSVDGGKHKLVGSQGR